MLWISKIIELKSLFIPEVVYETCFYYFWEGKCLLHLNLFFINNYFWVHRPNSSMKGDEGGIFSKASDWKFLIKIKIKTQAAQIRNTIQPSSTFIRISVPIPEVKKNHWLRKYRFILGKIWAKWLVSKQIRFVPNILEHFFFMKTGNLIINWVPTLSPTNILCLKDYLHNLRKYEIMRT